MSLGASSGEDSPRENDVRGSRVWRAVPALLVVVFLLGMLSWYGGAARTRLRKVESGADPALPALVLKEKEPEQEFQKVEKEKPKVKEKVVLPPVPAWNASSSVSKWPTLFCFALMIPNGPERGLLETAAQLKAGIFGCDQHAIFSNIPGKVWGTPISVLWNVNLWCDKQPTPTWAGGAGPSGPWSAANTRIFKIVWDAVLKDERSKTHDWIVKADADTVFLPQSLRGALINQPFVASWYNPGGSYLGNCALGLYGGLEVISRKASYVMRERVHECPWVPQEDAWLRTCFQRLNVQNVPAYGAFCLRGCDLGMHLFLQSKGNWVQDTCPNQFTDCIGPKAAFHAFKTPETYRACYWKASSTSH